METKVEATALVANTDSYDVISGMGLLGSCFGMMDPLTEEFIWRRDCHDTERVTTRIGRLLARCRGTNRGRRHNYMTAIVSEATDLFEALLWDEEAENEVIDMVNVVETDLAPMNSIKPIIPALTHSFAHRRREAVARLEAALEQSIPVQEPRTKWIGGANHGAIPLSTHVCAFEKESIERSMHVLDLFVGITCGGLGTVIEPSYIATYYFNLEIDDVSRAITRQVLSTL